MTQLTNDMIIQKLNNGSSFLRLELILFGLLFLGFVIAFFIKLKYSSRKKSTIIGVVIATLLIGIPIFISSLKYNAIQYSIKNNCFEVVTDTIVRTDSSRDDDGHTTHYIYLANNGKIAVSSSTYLDCSTEKSVYVVIANGRFGGKYLTGQIYPTRYYQYMNK